MQSIAKSFNSVYTLLSPTKTMSHPEGMQTPTARLASFDSPKTKGRKRTSTKGKKASTNWPLESPTPEELAQAGFYLTATASSPDNVTCFHCLKSLDEWEEGDNPFREHLQFAPECAWAVTVAVERGVILKDEEHDPLADEFVDMRVATYGTSWPHENKKGWTPKIKKLVDAGWHYHPMPDEDDQTKCAYCNLCVSGWEPKDKPIEEHKRRSPECSFFRLIDAHKKTRKARKARASKVSRASTLSTATFSKETQSMLDDVEANIDDSIMTTATDVTTASTATNATTATRKSGRAKKPTAKATRGKKKVDAEAEAEEESEKMEVEVDETPKVEDEPEHEPEPARPGRKRSSAVMLEDEDEEPAPATKKRAGRGRSSTARPVSISTTDVDTKTSQETETSHEEPSIPEVEEPAVQDASMTNDEPETLAMPKRGRKGSTASRTAGSRTVSKTTRKASGGRKASQRKASAASVSVATVVDATAMTDAEIEAKLEADLERPLSDEEEDPLSGEANHQPQPELEPEPEPKPKRGRPKKAASRTVSKTVAQPQPMPVEAEEEAGVDMDAVIDELAKMEQEEEPVPAAKLFVNHYEETDEGLEGSGHESEGSVIVKPKGKRAAKTSSAAPAPKAKRGRPAKSAASKAAEPKSGGTKAHAPSEQDEPTELRFSSSFEEMPSAFEDSEMIEEKPKPAAKPATKPAKAAKAVKAPAATKKGKGKKASAVLTKSDDHFEMEQQHPPPKESTRPPSPSPPPPPQRQPAQTKRAATPEEEAPTPAAPTPGAFSSPTPSLSSPSSNAENEPPSSRPPSTRPPLGTLTPNQTTTTRVPLGSAAPSTPSRSIARTHNDDASNGDSVSPGWALQSGFPWRPVDIETIFLQSPDSKPRNTTTTTGPATNATKWFPPASDQENAATSQPLHASKDIITAGGKAAAGTKKQAASSAAATREKQEKLRQMQATLSAAEKEMTVEQWIRSNAARGEEMLRRECERVVGRFEGEGIRAMKALEGLVVEEWA